MGAECSGGTSKSWDKLALKNGTECPINLGMSDSGLTSFRSVIELWDSREAMAADVGANNWAVIKWFKRDNIPSEWWLLVLSTEQARAAGATSDLFARLAARDLNVVRA
jgi:hypothetical protein